MTKSDTIKKKAMIEALESSLGVVTTACKSVGLSRQTHYRWMDEDGKYKVDVLEVDNIALDFAESALHKNISEGKETSTIFFLKTRGKKRGYIEKMEIDNNHSGEVKSTINATQLKGAIKEVLDNDDC